MATPEQLALLEDFCTKEVQAWLAACPEDAKKKALERPEAEQLAEFEATWKTADTNQDDLLNAAEFDNFREMMGQNEKAYSGFGLPHSSADSTELYNKLITLCPGKDGVD